jgi:hypothetical protein
MTASFIFNELDLLELRLEELNEVVDLFVLVLRSARSGAQFGTNFLCNFTPENGSL